MAEKMMTYLLFIVASIFSFATFGMLFASEIVSGNITHLENDRQPNAGAAIFPAILFFPLLYIGMAWLLKITVNESAIWILSGLFLVFVAIWGVNFRRLVIKYKKMSLENEPNVES